jgi:hypothetical protein
MAKAKKDLPGFFASRGGFETRPYVQKESDFGGFI